MPATSIQAAVDEILAMVKAAWGAVGPIQWPNMKNLDPLPDGTWCRVTLRHQDGGQVSLSDAIGSKRWDRVGTLWMQVFTLPGDGNQAAYDLCNTLMTAFEGKCTASGVWFRNVRLNEVGVDGGYWQNNVLVQFEYDQIH